CRKRKWPWYRAAPLAPAEPASCAWPMPPRMRRSKRRSTACSALCGGMSEKDYSHRDITDKLGLKPGHAVKVVGRGDKDLLKRAREKIGRGFIKTGVPD